MSDHSLPQPGPVAAFGVHVWRKQRPWLAFALVLLAVALLDPAQVWASVDKVAGALVSIAPFLTVSILIAAWAGLRARTT